MIINRGKPHVASDEELQQRYKQQISRSSPQQQNKVLLLGDSIINGVNRRGLKSGIHKNSKSGGNIHTIIEEVRLYDLKAFSAVIIYAGGNNVASGQNIKFIEEKV